MDMRKKQREFGNNYKTLIYQVYGEKAKIIEDISIVFTDKYSYESIKEYRPNLNINCIEKLKQYDITLIKNHSEKKNNSCLKGILSLLGIYLPREQQIILFSKAIFYASNVLNIDSKILTQVAIVHELSHFLSHKYPINEKVWEGYVNSFKDNIKMHEFIAQLSTCVILKPNDTLFNAFVKLSKNQAEEYQITYRYSTLCCIEFNPNLYAYVINVFRNGLSWKNKENDEIIAELISFADKKTVVNNFKKT